MEKAERNPSGLRFAELETLVSHYGWTLDHQTGSHRIWLSPMGFRLPVQEANNGKAKGYQVKQFLARLAQEITDEERTHEENTHGEP